MKALYRYVYIACLSLSPYFLYAQKGAITGKVNVFFGTSGDHGQLSPGASAPFDMMDVAPQTYPNIHTGYEQKAKVILGFTHDRLEGVGCMGSGGNLLIKPFLSDPTSELIKVQEKANPGFYSIGFRNGIHAAFAVYNKTSIEKYFFPKKKHGFYIDLAHALTNKFIAEKHQLTSKTISGWIESSTTCRAGVYRVYYDLEFAIPVKFIDSTLHTFTVDVSSQEVTIRVAFFAVNEGYAKSKIKNQSFAKIKTASNAAWERELNQLQVEGDPKETGLFYSLLYRTMQSPYNISEADGTYRATDGTIRHSGHINYNGWSIWDNYKTQLPLLSLIEPEKYQDMITSIASLYQNGKRNWATKTEPSNTVRTEHAIVVLLDAYRKGYIVDFKSIRDSLLKESEKLDFAKPDKALESSYDTWALSQILSILKEDSLSAVYKERAAQWKMFWNKDFKDLGKSDIDQLNARQMYQGTIWQYRWFVPFDLKGLIEQCGGERAYIAQLDEFFKNDYYNAANEPDIQVPYLYNMTSQPWKSQAMIRKYAKDTVIQYYYDDNYRGINPTIGRIYNNRADAMVLSMDDDAGAMSGWYILSACGLSPACVGWPVYYLHVPLFRSIKFNNTKPFMIHTVGKGRYIRSARLNGNILSRNWLTQQEIMQGGELTISASNKPNKTFGVRQQWITDINKDRITQ
jgi:putative alpha-1,2-mannosidase